MTKYPSVVAVVDKSIQVYGVKSVRNICYQLKDVPLGIELTMHSMEKTVHTQKIVNDIHIYSIDKQ